MHASYWGKAGQWQQEEQGSLRPGTPVIISAHYQSLLEEKYRVLYTLHLTPNSSLGPGSFGGGGPLLVPMVWGLLECLGNHRRLDILTGGGMERKGCTQTLDEGDKRGAWWGGRGWGISWGPRQLAGLGSRREGPGQMVIIDFWVWGEGGEDHAGCPERGVISGPGVAHGAQSHVSLLSTSPPSQYLMQNLSPRVSCPFPALLTTCP